MRETLKAMCDQYGFSLRDLAGHESLVKNETQSAVTFVENHDMRDAGRPIYNDKLLAYGFILTHEGYPCVFWQDYYVDGLAMLNTQNGIAALVAAHEKYAGGGTDVLWLDDGLYVMQRQGFGDQRGLIYVLNNRGDGWSGAWVQTQWPGVEFEPVAWWGHSDLSRPDVQFSAADGRAQFWAPPRGYVVYAPVL